MKSLTKIFSVFLSLSLVLAVSYCCCIKDALAKQNHSCCAQKNNQSSNQKDHACPRLVSSFGDQTLDVVKVDISNSTIHQVIEKVLIASSTQRFIQPAFDGPPGSSSEIPQYIQFHNFRI